ncbi:MAG: hypothetical protein P8099_19225 [Gemmatimonadota bacterium]
MPHHLLTVWNPAYADDALDAHLRVLLRWAERSRDPQDDATPDDVYVWWAKIRSPNRDQALRPGWAGATPDAGCHGAPAGARRRGEAGAGHGVTPGCSRSRAGRPAVGAALV